MAVAVQSDQRRARRLPWIVAAGFLLATAGAWLGLRTLDRAAFQSGLDQAIDARSNAIQRELMVDISAVQLARPFIGDTLERRDFDRFAEQLLLHHPLRLEQVASALVALLLLAAQRHQLRPLAHYRRSRPRLQAEASRLVRPPLLHQLHPRQG